MSEQVDWGSVGRAQALCEVVALLRHNIDKFDRREIKAAQGGRASDSAAAEVFAAVSRKLAELEQAAANELAGCHDVITAALYELVAMPAGGDA